MARTASQVAAWAESQKDRSTSGWVGLCLKFCRMAAGAAGGVVDANAGWARARYKHYNRNIPRGAIGWYAGGKHGHVVVGAGNGDVYSNDIVRRGKIDRVPVSRPEQRWGQRWRGWSEDVNGVHIAGLGSGPMTASSSGKVTRGTITIKGTKHPDLASVSVYWVNSGRSTKRMSRHIWYTQRWLNKVMGGANVDEDGRWDAPTQELFDRFRREKLGIRGSDATGKVGLYSLARLNDMAKSAKPVRSGK